MREEKENILNLLLIWG